MDQLFLKLNQKIRVNIIVESLFVKSNSINEMSL
jgi:hypothetical protein